MEIPLVSCFFSMIIVWKVCQPETCMASYNDCNSILYAPPMILMFFLNFFLNKQLPFFYLHSSEQLKGLEKYKSQRECPSTTFRI